MERRWDSLSEVGKLEANLGAENGAVIVARIGRRSGGRRCSGGKRCPGGEDGARQRSIHAGGWARCATRHLLPFRVFSGAGARSKFFLSGGDGAPNSGVVGVDASGDLA